MTKTMTTDTGKAAHALNRLLEIALAFVGTQALASGHKLGVFEALADGPMTSDELAKRIHVKPIACRRLLMALASLNLVVYEQGSFEIQIWDNSVRLDRKSTSALSRKLALSTTCVNI
jgi:amino acid permease